MQNGRNRDHTDIEWPTIALLVACYLTFAVATTVVAGFWLPLGIGLTALAITLHSSLQHEVLHDHPFATRALNEALVFPSLGLCIPYQRFRDTHLAHHHDEVLTDPYDDPEANYLDPAVWQRLSPALRWVLRANNTLLGRIILGPVVSMVVFYRMDWAAIRAGDRVVRSGWLWHLPGLALVMLWLGWVGRMPVWAYMLAAYLGFGILKIRTFLEHRAHERASGRTVVVEDRGILAFLFLNNNFHIVHHMHPKVSWYDLPALYAQNRDRYLTRNGGYRYGSYAEVFRLHFLKAKDPVEHPLWLQK